MPDFWLDADSLISPHRGAHRFSFDTPLWNFLEMRARDGIIGSPQIVFDDEIASTNKLEEKDSLELWARELKGILFLQPIASVQDEYAKVANYIQNCGNYTKPNIAKCLSGADPWLVAYAMALGGKIVTFEASAPKSRDPKIPDVAKEFGIKCVNLWDMLDALKFRSR
jgi:hypothetical protein